MPRLANHEIICDRYRVETVLSDTANTKVCTVLDGTGHKYAAKLTRVHETQTGSGSFRNEVEVFDSLTNGRISFGHRLSGQTPEGFPNVYFVGKHGNEYNVIVMDFLSPDLFQLCELKNLSMKAHQHLGCEMLDRLKELHRHGFVHRDVKPQNFMMDGRGKVHLIDFGLSTRFRDPQTNAHLPERQENFLSGTLIYSSINAQRMITQSRRDDLESLGYSLLEMIKKELPWEAGYNSRREPEERVAYIKENTTVMTLCRGLPKGIQDYMMTVSTMSYSEAPNYNSLREMLKR